MSIPDFERAEYIGSESLVATTPEAAFTPLPYVPVDSHAAFLRALLFGLGGALVGAAIYAIVGLFIQIGFVAILVGVLVGNGMMNGSNGAGGRRYQISSLLLTYFAVNFALVLDMLWVMAKKGPDMGTLFAHYLLGIAFFLVAGPFMLLRNHFGDGLFLMLMLFFGMRAAWRVTKGGQNYYHLRPYNPDRPLNLRD